jgi:YidC/Oxa1 family membrane protein insertase
MTLTKIFVDPFLNLFVGLLNIMPGHDLGLAIISLTFLVRVLLYPLSAQQIRSQRAMQEMQPRINEIREKHKDDKEAQTKALMEFYKKNKVNPLSSCGPLIIQTLFILPLFYVFRLAITGGDFSDRLYSFVTHPTLPLDSTFLGFVDLAGTHNIPLAVLTAGAQFLQSWMLMRRRTKSTNKQANASEAASRNLAYILPLLTGYFAYSFPAGLALYWLASTTFAIIQQLIIMRTVASKPIEPDGHKEVVVVK